MGFISVCPILNNIPFVREDVTLPTQYHRLHMQDDWYKNLVREWQFSRPYKKPIQQSDKQYIVFGREDNNDMAFQIYDDCGNLVDISSLGYTDSKVQADFVIYDSNAVSVNDGVETPLSVHMWSFRFSDFDLPDGVYFLRMIVEFYDGVDLIDTKYWLTEPLDVRADHPDTILIEAYNETNKGDVIFSYDTTDGTGYKGDFFFTPKFGYRVPGDFVNYGFDSNDNDFIEQDYEKRNLNPTAWENKILQIGGEHGVPAYEFQKINHALVCDFVKAEGLRITKDSGAKWEMSDSKTSTLFNGEIQIVDYNYKHQITDNRAAKILLFEEPAGYPYWIYQAGFTELFYLLSGGKYITSSTDRNNLVTELNTDYADFWDLDGTFVFENGGVYYENAVGETFTAAPAKVLTDYLDIEINVPSNGNYFGLRAINIDFSASYGGIVWGDGNQQNFLCAGKGATKTLTNTYTTLGDYTVRLFPVQTLERISILRNDYNSVIKNITGDLPSGCRQFIMLCNRVDFVGLASGLNLDFIANARFVLSQLAIVNAGFTAFDGDIFASYPAIGITGNNGNWLTLNGISFFKCALASAEVEGFIEDFYVFTPKQVPVNIELRQGPAAPVTNTPATTYVTNLNNSGSTVTTD